MVIKAGALAAGTAGARDGVSRERERTETVSTNASTIESGYEGVDMYWKIGEILIRATPGPRGWDATARCPNWTDDLRVDGRFATRDEAAVWCRNLADVFARDQEDDALAG